MAGPHNIDLSAAVVPSTVTVSLTTTGEVYQLHLPRSCGAVVLSPAGECRVGYTVSASITDTSAKLPADSSTEWEVYPVRGSSEGARLCLQGAASPTKVAVHLLPREGVVV